MSCVECQCYCFGYVVKPEGPQLILILFYNIPSFSTIKHLTDYLPWLITAVFYFKLNYRKLKNRFFCYPYFYPCYSDWIITLYSCIPSPHIDCVPACFSGDSGKVTTVVATPGQGPDRPQEVSYTDIKVSFVLTCRSTTLPHLPLWLRLLSLHCIQWLQYIWLIWLSINNRVAL